MSRAKSLSFCFQAMSLFRSTGWAGSLHSRGPDGVGRVDEIALGLEEPADLRQVLRPHSQFQLLGCAHHPRAAPEPASTFLRVSGAVLFDIAQVKTLGVGVHVLHVIVKAAHVAEFLNTADGVGKGLIAAALGVGR